MTSAIPYDPFDDIDNNPFSEPAVESAPGTHDADEARDNEAENQPQLQKGDEERSVTAPGEDQDTTLQEQLENLVPERKNTKFTLVVKVTGLERVGSLANKKDNPAIIFDASTNLPTFRKPKHRNLKKTMSEFQNLFKYLNAALPETFVPSLPAPSTNYGIQNNEDYQKTQSAMQEWFDRICGDPLVLRCEELAFFIESDFNTYTPIGKVKSTVTGLRRKTLKQLAPPFDECLELAQFRPLVKSIHYNCHEIQLKLYRLSKLRKMLSQDENGVGQTFTEMLTDSSQIHTKLYKRFGKTLTAVGDIDSVVATLDMATLYDGLAWIVQDTYVVKEALTNRHFLMRELLQAQQNTKFRQDQARRLRVKRDVNPLKVDEAIRALKTATTAEHELTLKLQRTTANMLFEKQRWLEWYSHALTAAIREYTLRKIEYERKKLTLLERIKSDVRSADLKGGLSRLGRGASTSSTTGPSQTPQGDSWTGNSRYRHFQPGVLQTEFDNSLQEEQDSTHPTDPEEQRALDARNAAALLGTSTF
ncbi:LAMI_0E14488g1_1 [Lachancea mirantina]|uniref:Vacuolar protein sorting-associated protein 17 n=1 Tax=Lachancea mirantina TaxID=1230905 RepID=A0A1G4JRM8_9SACH|nr:LAMI_0E14488g1_1 [Lachancea mirantina]